jgi:uncharacterized membrane protein YfcA
MILLIQILSASAYSACIDCNGFGESCTEETKRKICGEKLICFNGTCSNCDIDPVQCSLSGNIVCKIIILPDNFTNSTTITHLCEHKDAFDNFNGYDGGAIILTFIVGMFAAISGIGGGGILAVIMLMMEFPISVTARIAKSMIFGGACANILMYLPAKHYHQNKPLIDYNVAMILEPYTLAGTIFGVIINMIFPDWLLTLVLIIVLIAINIRLIFKIKRLYNDEDKKNNDIEIDSVVDQISEHEKNDDDINRYFVLPKISVLILSTIVLIAFTFVKGGSKYDGIADIEFCSGLYWGITVIQFMTIVLICICVGMHLRYAHTKKKRNNYNFQKGDIKWTIVNTFILPPLFILAGLLASSLGLGGGIIKGPIMLELKMLPEVVVATSSFMIFFTSMGSVSQYLILGKLPVDYTILYAINGFISAIIGQLIVGYIFLKKPRPTILIVIMSVLITLTILAAFGYGSYDFATDVQDGVHIGFNSFCST